VALIPVEDHLTAVQLRANIYGIEVEMENTKLTIRISKNRLEKAKIFAKENNTIFLVWWMNSWDNYQAKQSREFKNR